MKSGISEPFIERLLLRGMKLFRVMCYSKFAQASSVRLRVVSQFENSMRNESSPLAQALRL